MLESMREVTIAIRKNYCLLLLISIFALSALTACGGGSNDRPSDSQCALLLLILGPFLPKECYSSSSSTVGVTTETLGDVVPPSTPTGLTATSVSSGGQAPVTNLYWNDSNDNDVVKGYKVYRDGLQIQDLTGTSFSDAGLDDNVQYCYAVSAYDAAGNESTQSEPVCPAATATKWNVVVLDTSADVQSTSIALDALDHVHISYLDGRFIGFGQQVGDVKYATNASGSWSSATIDNVGSIIRAPTSIAVDKADAVHTGYYVSDHNELRHVTSTAGIWRPEVVDPATNVSTLSLALDTAGRVHLVYDDDGDLLYANNIAGFWTTEIVGSVNTDKAAAVAVDLSNAAHIAYYYYPTGALRYVSNATGSWSTQTVDDHAGHYVAIAVDAKGWAHLSYYDAINRDLKYATNASGMWVTQTIDSSGDVGTSTAIALDAAGKVHISYTDDTNHDLKYATNASDVWRTYVIDSTWVSGISATPGAYTSIAVDSIGKVHVSYRGDAALMYATNR